MLQTLLRNFRDLPLQRKLLASFIMVSGVVLLSAEFVFILNGAISFQREQREALTSVAAIIAHNSTAALAFDDRAAASQTMASLANHSHIMAGYLVAKDGQLAASYHRPEQTIERGLEMRDGEPAKNLAALDRYRSEQHESLHWCAPIGLHEVVLDGQQLGTVTLCGNLAPFRDDFIRQLFLGIAVFIASIALVFIIARRLQRMITAPIFHLTETMREVSISKNYALRANKESTDETGLLADGFNEMLAEIEDRNEALRQRQLHLQQLAHFDNLTSLPNRVLFYDRLGQTLRQADRSKQVVAVFFIDLDHFKDINDSLGHRVGDLLLQQVARRLTAAVRACDTVSRLGGDEFTICIQNVATVDSSDLVAQHLLAQFAAPFELEKQEIYISASIGVTHYPFDGTTVDELLKNADVAMYVAKDRGKNCYQFFAKEMNHLADSRLAMQHDLRQALELSELSLYYQPKINLASGAITSMEALVRWHHPQQGLILPNKFIPLAEDTGLIVPLGEWVIRSACRQAMAWQTAGSAPLRVAVNMSSCQFKRPGIIDTITAILTETGLSPQYLEIELTESVLLHGNEQTIEVLNQFRRLGISIAIDDFGTGYSSLSYLHRLPIDSLKIDKSFIWNLTSSVEDAAIITAIIAMANSLGLNVIAEGVETQEQLAFLRERGCREAQGYLFSHPLPAAEINRLFPCERTLAATGRLKWELNPAALLGLET